MGALEAHAQLTQLRRRARGRHMVSPLPAQSDGRFDIACNVIDKHHFRGLDIRQLDPYLAEAGVVDQAAGAFGQEATGVLLGVPGLGADVVEKPLSLVIIGNPLAVQVLRAPIKQDTAESKTTARIVIRTSQLMCCICLTPVTCVGK